MPLTEDGRAPGHRHLRPEPGPPGRLPGVVGTGGPARRQPGDGDRLQRRHLLGRRALVPALHHLPDPGRSRALDGLRQPERARPLPGRAHRRRPPRHGARDRPAPLGRRVRLPGRRDRGVRDRAPRRRTPPRRLLATVLFTDIVDSTVRAAAAGDRQWRAVLDEFDVNVGRLLARHDGILVKIDRRRDPGPLRRTGPGGALRRRHGGDGPRPPAWSCGPACTPARWSCAATTSAAWPSTSPRG